MGQDTIPAKKTQEEPHSTKHPWENWKKHISKKWEKFHEAHQMDQFFDEELEDLLSTELVTITSRQAQTVDEVPNIITIITQDEIRQSGARTLGEALSLAPGIHLRHASPFNAGETVHAEGFVMRGTVLGGSKHILFLLDGQRLNDSQSGGITNTLGVIPLHNVKRVELIRGLGSARYGTSAFTGVVNIITKKGDDLRGGEITTSVHSHEGFSHSLLIGDKKGDWTASFHGFYSNDDGQEHSLKKIDGNTERIRDGREFKNIALDIQYKQAFFHFHHYEHETDPFVTFGRANLEDEKLTETNGTSTLASVGYEWEYSAGSFLLDFQHSRFISKFSGIQAEKLEVEQLLDASKNITANNLNQIFGGRVSDDIRLEINLQWLHRFSSDHVFELGITSTKEILVESSLIDNVDAKIAENGLIFLSGTEGVVKTTISRDRERHIRGIYLQDNYRVNPEISVYLGARYDDYSDFGNTFNPRAGLVYRYSQQQMIKMVYGTAFRAPSFQDQFDFRSEGGLSIVENDLDSEKIEMTEVQYQYGISSIYKFKFNIYHGWVRDFIFPPDIENEQDDKNDEEQTLTNNLDLQTSGIEAEFRIEPRPQHYLTINVSRAFLEVTQDGKRQPVWDNNLLPQTIWNLIYNLPYQDWFNANTSISYRSEQVVNPELDEALPAYTVLNFHVLIRPPRMNATEVFFGVRNLTDAEAYSPLHSLNNFPERGRELLGGIRAAF